MKNLKSKIVILLLPLAMSCETTNEATGLGGATGALVGGGVGALADSHGSSDKRIKNVAIGAAAGALLGAGLGYGVQKEVQKHEGQAYQKGKNDGRRNLADYTGPEGQPRLIPPQVEAVYIEDQIKGKVFIPAHVEYRIIEQARWEQK